MTRLLEDEGAALVRPLVEELAAEGLPLTLADGPGPRDPLRPSMWLARTGASTFQLRRTPHVSEGEEGQAIEIDTRLGTPEGNRVRLRDWLSEIASLLRQDAEIIAQGHDPARAPPRFHVAHPLVAEAIAAWGVDADEVCRMTGLDAAVVRTEVAGMRVQIARRTVRRRVRVANLSVATASGGRGPRLAYSESPDPVVTLFGWDAPEGVAARLAGMTVGDVTGAAGALAPLARHRIVAATTDSGGTRLQLGPGLVPLA